MKWNELQDLCKLCLRLRCQTPRMSGDHDYDCGRSLYFIKKKDDCEKFDPDIEAIESGEVEQWVAYCED